ncbi:hypothetical protein [Nocardiopsis lucentensis]|uniref:hypothetical protein n=1 Tax=Nocardiopsis lucentensis TaxID=53441 RepID=UPI00034543D7|nr:hypothetical protein [Nocardiopsis lucentensis]
MASISRPPATRADFPCFSPVLEPYPLPPVTRLWTADQWAGIRLGLVSREMEERWDAFVEDDRLLVMRSWTGRCFYEAVFAPRPGGWRITGMWGEGARPDTAPLHSLFLELLILGSILGTPDRALWERFDALGGLSGMYGPPPGGPRARPGRRGGH